jgi:hypothetical protein
LKAINADAVLGNFECERTGGSVKGGLCSRIDGGSGRRDVNCDRGIEDDRAAVVDPSLLKQPLHEQHGCFEIDRHELIDVLLADHPKGCYGSDSGRKKEAINGATLVDQFRALFRVDEICSNRSVLAAGKR